jgi:hypothetical protein
MMFRSGFVLLALFGAVALSTSQSAARNIDASNPEAVANVLQKAGYRAKVTKSSNGDPEIESSAGGKPFYIFFNGCKNNTDCRHLSFTAYWLKGSKTFSVDKANAWNASKVVGTAYMDKDGDYVLKMFVNLDDGGIHEGNLEDWVEWWQVVVGEFDKHVSN